MGAIAKKETEGNVTSISEQALSKLAMQSVEVKVGTTTFKAVKRVTVPTLGHDFAKGEKMVAVEFLTKFVGSPTKMLGARPDQMNYAARVIDLTTGEVCNYVGASVVLSEINQAYPDESYVGKKLVIEKIPGPSGKRYNRANIVEVE